MGFFGLPEEYKIILHKEIFTLSFYSEGAFPFSDVWDMPTYLRKFYMMELEEALKNRKSNSQESQPNKDKNFAHISNNVTHSSPQKFSTKMK